MSEAAADLEKARDFYELQESKREMESQVFGVIDLRRHPNWIRQELGSR